MKTSFLHIRVVLFVWSCITITTWIVSLYLYGDTRFSQANDDEIWQTAGESNFESAQTWTQEIADMSIDPIVNDPTDADTGVKDWLWTGDIILNSESYWSILNVEWTWEQDTTGQKSSQIHIDTNWQLQIWYNNDTTLWSGIVDQVSGLYNSDDTQTVVVLDTPTNTTLTSWTIWWYDIVDHIHSSGISTTDMRQESDFLPEYPQWFDNYILKSPTSLPSVNQSGLRDPTSVSSYDVKNIATSDYPLFSSLVARHNITHLTKIQEWFTGWSKDDRMISLGNALSLVFEGTEQHELVLVSTIDALYNQLDSVLKSWKSVTELYLYQSNDSNLYSNQRYLQWHRAALFYWSDYNRYVLDPTTMQHTQPVLLTQYLQKSNYTNYGINIRGYVSSAQYPTPEKTQWECITECGQIYCEDENLIGKTIFALDRAEINKKKLTVKWSTNMKQYLISVCITNDQKQSQSFDVQTDPDKGDKQYHYHINQKISIDSSQSMQVSIILHDINNIYVGLHTIPLMDL